MRILVEILHPAHVHVFKHAVASWKSRGDEVLVLSREKECANDLLRAYGIPFESISRIGGRKISLVGEMLVRDFRMLRAALKFKPDLLTGIMGVTVAQVGRLIGRPAVVFYDTENATLTNRFTYPLAHSVCTPECYQGPVRGRHVTYPGYHELAYLHPDRFRPDPAIVKSLGIEPGEPFFIVRFVSWQASHDVGESGVDLDFKRKIIFRLKDHGRVLISSESPLPEDLQPFTFSLPPQDLHHALAFARLVIGESATMASEAAVLGVPALFISDTGRGYTDDEARFGLVHHFRRPERDRILSWLDDHLQMHDARSFFAGRRRQLLEGKVDLTSWMIDYLDGVGAERRGRGSA
jgi:predicted glycosyltransferase